MIDTGVWPEHPSFRDTGLPAPAGTYGCQFGDGTDVLNLGPTFACNKKLIGAYAFTNTYMAVIGTTPGEYCNNITGRCSARDPDGHGTHTSSTAAGDPVASAPISVGKNSKSLFVEAGAEITFPITISAPTLANGQYFGRITLDPQKKGANSVTIPVAFFKRQGAVTLTHACDTNTVLEKTGHAHCAATLTNGSAIAADATLTVTNLDKGKGLDFTNITAPATAIKKNDGVEWSGTLSPTIPPQVTSITPTAGVGDDTISNFNVPAFRYGSEPYTRVGVVSNGYLVLGGGTGADIVFLPQTFPNPARPNNVVAPFWTDLNPAAAGLIRIATLSDGVSTWLVVDWAGVRNFSNPPTHSFEVWLRLGTTAASEQITLTYGTNGAGDPGSGSNWGAENRDGTSGKNIPAQPANGSEFAVVLAPPQAGGTVTIEYDASAAKAGRIARSRR